MIVINGLSYRMKFTPTYWDNKFHLNVELDIVTGQQIDRDTTTKYMFFTEGNTLEECVIVLLRDLEDEVYG
jgi:hypothetical protein